MSEQTLNKVGKADPTSPISHGDIPKPRKVVLKPKDYKAEGNLGNITENKRVWKEHKPESSTEAK